MAAPPTIPLSPHQECLLAIPGAGLPVWRPARTIFREGDRVWLHVEPAAAQRLIDERVEETTIETWRAGDARYLLYAQIETIELTPQPCITARVVGASRNQRRAYFRVAGALLLEQACVADGHGIRYPLDLVLHDVSAGGLGARLIVGLRAVTRPVPVTLGTRLLLEMRVPGEPAPVPLEAEVVRMVDTRGERTESYDIGAAFVDVPADLQERLIHCMLRAQHEQARRGLL